MNAPRVSVKDVRLFERPIVLRMPFRFGIVTLTHAPQAYALVRVDVEGRGEFWGAAAEMMGPKWFDKNPDLSNERNFDQLREALFLAADNYRAAGAATAFGLFAACHAEQIAVGRSRDLNPLVSGYGPALLDRAVLDAVCKAEGTSFWEGMRANVAGITQSALFADLDGFDFSGFLASLRPRDDLHVRHTVGMADRLENSAESAVEPIDDGLPETLADVADVYGCTYYKIKVRGEPEADLARLTDIARLLELRFDRYRITLDGNEQFRDLAGVLDLWQRMASTPALAKFVDSILFLEQPIGRAWALDTDVAALSDLRPVIIDESDADLDAFPTARARGYRGVSSKTCKGIYKSIVNAARCRSWNAAVDKERFILSGEDLTCQPGLSVQQDLALVSLLGIRHVERNGHHYVRGMAGAPAKEQDAFFAAHSDLYERRRGVVCLKVRDGRVSLGSLDVKGFAAGAAPEWSGLAEMACPLA